jgi:hypothetical protein
MPPFGRPIQVAGEEIDLSGRFVHSVTVAASPAGASETTIATLTITADASLQKGIYLDGWAAYTVGTSGTAVTLKIRRTDTSGQTIASSGALTRAAGVLAGDDVAGVDTGPTLPGQVYVLTMTVTAGAAASTVSAVMLRAIVV